MSVKPLRDHLAVGLVEFVCLHGCWLAIITSCSSTLYVLLSPAAFDGDTHGAPGSTPVTGKQRGTETTTIPIQYTSHQSDASWCRPDAWPVPQGARSIGSDPRIPASIRPPPSAPR